MVRKSWLVALAVWAGVFSFAVAQDDSNAQNLDAPEATAVDVAPAKPAPLWSSPTSHVPSMAQQWSTPAEERSQLDPKEAVRRRAEMKAAQRGERLAAMQWYGMSNSRPMASSTPFMGTYSPTWMGATGRTTMLIGPYRRALPWPLYGTEGAP